MIISDLSHLEVVSEAPSVAGGITTFSSSSSAITTYSSNGGSSASAGFGNVVADTSLSPLVSAVASPFVANASAQTGKVVTFATVGGFP